MKSGAAAACAQAERGGLVRHRRRMTRSNASLTNRQPSRTSTLDASQHARAGRATGWQALRSHLGVGRSGRTRAANAAIQAGIERRAATPQAQGRTRSRWPTSPSTGRRARPRASSARWSTPSPPPRCAARRRRPPPPAPRSTCRWARRSASMPPCEAISDDTSTTATVPPSLDTISSAWSAPLLVAPDERHRQRARDEARARHRRGRGHRRGAGRERRRRAGRAWPACPATTPSRRRAPSVGRHAWRTPAATPLPSLVGSKVA